MITKTNNRTRLAMSGTTYDFDFRIDSEDELVVYGIDSDGVSTELTTGFTVSFSAADEEGTVTFSIEPTDYAEILMLRDKAYTQSTDIPIRGGFDESVIEGALDSIVIQIQQLKELIYFCVKQDPTAVAVNVTLPTPEDGKALVWDGTTGTLANSTIDLSALEADIAAVDAAVTAAQLAETNAETAETNAEAAQLAAEAAAAAFTLASQAEAEAGSENTKYMSPLRTAQSIAALGGKFYVGRLTRGMTAASGPVEYTGVGFTPKAILFMGASPVVANSSSIGVATPLADGNLFNDNQVAFAGSAAAAIMICTAAPNQRQDATVSVWGTDGFTLSWAKTGSPTGTAVIIYLAFG
jgi:hypothetical protein